MQQPQPTDVTFGGQIPPPGTSAILGGLEGLQQQLAAATAEQRSQLLTAALNYGDAGIDLLIATLNQDPVLTVRAAAYQQLQQAIATSTKLSKQRNIEQAIANGIPLKQGDRLYRVYISAVDYDDQYYTLLDSVEAYEAHDFCYEGEQFYPVERYMSKEEADRVATDLHRVILSNGSFAEFNQRHQLKLKFSNCYLLHLTDDLCNFYRNYSQPVQSWCADHNVDIDLSDYLSEDDLADLLADLSDDQDNEYWWEAQEAVFEKLQQDKNYPLLEEFCDWVEMGRFTFVQEEVVDRDGFLAVTAP